ncbi:MULTISPECIES: beta-ketoacyl synthase N-terminal-like domain-containing protein [unclassified Polaribacter]|uniref:beta-ketoacyl synthase N-terminal-like domain-containing protein n=1 Tax=unclassified Polaribacter TaxID=196858 RepID=UPI0011BEA22A|nr:MULTISPECIES: beta-ketoacyl synthase N-terminal-like domain-containing protein [unclassified Polaribacter]TXD53188.1 beta-ketoacyl synthase [Polaribacter sp. IC063]TXD61336.1 beta-ketoacyl synthase [Polaribacter sp. IC066]
MIQPVSITSIASISALGSSPKEIWQNYLSNTHFLSEKEVSGKTVFVGQLSAENQQKIRSLRKSDSKYRNLDDSVLFAIYVSREAVKNSNWKSEKSFDKSQDNHFGINFGSSRGATSLFEKYHKEFLETQKSSTLSSPTTTLGNISSWVAHDLQTSGPEISHSVTCSTALHSLLNGVAWINSGMSEQFLVGGSEAALTDFTIAQMQALKVYAKHDADAHKEFYPCKSFDLKKKQNTMVLGEGASAICLEKGFVENALATIVGVGFATEVLQHNTSISADAKCFQKSMKMALGEIKVNEIDVIVMHAPGTIKGDQSEVNAIKSLFGEITPFLTTNKWKLGHTFGASGMLSLELGLLMLQHQQVIEVPFAEKQMHPKKIKNVLINAVGFGGNAVSVLLSK